MENKPPKPKSMVEDFDPATVAGEVMRLERPEEQYAQIGIIAGKTRIIMDGVEWTASSHPIDIGAGGRPQVTLESPMLFETTGPNYSRKIMNLGEVIEEIRNRRIVILK